MVFGFLMDIVLCLGIFDLEVELLVVIEVEFVEVDV